MRAALVVQLQRLQPEEELLCRGALLCIACEALLQVLQQPFSEGIVCAHTRQLETHRPQIVVPPRQHLELLGEEGVDIPRNVTHLVVDRSRAEHL
jgi:hypothetical protein